MTVYTRTDLCAKIVSSAAHSWADVIQQNAKWPLPHMYDYRRPEAQTARPFSLAKCSKESKTELPVAVFTGFIKHEAVRRFTHAAGGSQQVTWDSFVTEGSYPPRVFIDFDCLS